MYIIYIHVYIQFNSLQLAAVSFAVRKYSAVNPLAALYVVGEQMWMIVEAHQVYDANLPLIAQTLPAAIQTQVIPVLQKTCLVPTCSLTVLTVCCNNSISPIGV